MKIKTIKQLKKQKPVFLNDFSDAESVFSNFELDKEKRDGINILFASYGQDHYSGDAYVLFEKNGKLFDVSGSHCSCYRLENQFDPSETTIEALTLALTEGKMGKDDWCGNEFAKELKEFIGIN